MKWCVLLVFLAASAAQAAVVPNALFTDRMVMQRNQKAAVYGTAAEGEAVTVSFNGQTLTTAATNGTWRVVLKPMTHGGPFTMTITGVNEVILNDILIGDVWVLGGQSNMGRPVRMYSWLMQRLPKLEESDRIRLFCLEYTDADKPSSKVITRHSFDRSWQHCTHRFMRDFSPLGYFFGVYRHKQNGIPLGLIYAARGATSVQSWVPESVLASDPAFAHVLDREKNPFYRIVKGQPNVLRPAGFYNGMVYPLQRYTIKGVIWNQGETDGRDAETYRLLFPAMIRCWRDAWGQGDFPFVFAQIASWKDLGWGLVKEPAESSWAWQRESQAVGLQEPNTFMVAAHDLGEWEDIHPQDKDTLGQRYALAVAKLDGEEGIASGPRYKAHRIEGNKVIITFDAVHGGLEARRVAMNNKRDVAPGKDPDAFVAEAGRLVGFLMCGPDTVFHPAEATIRDNEVVVTCAKVETPVAVRYAWATFALANLYNQEGLPAYPFRTDNFERTIPYGGRRK